MVEQTKLDSLMQVRRAVGPITTVVTSSISILKIVCNWFFLR